MTSAEQALNLVKEGLSRRSTDHDPTTIFRLLVESKEKPLDQDKENLSDHIISSKSKPSGSVLASSLNIVDVTSGKLSPL